MAHFDAQMREELRDDLMKTVGVAMRDELPKAMQIALLAILDNQIFAAIDHAIERFLAAEDMDCWLTFGANGPNVLVGVGPGEAAAYFEPKMIFETFSFDNISHDQEQEILDQITGIRNFIVQLDQAARLLEARAKAFTGRVVPLPVLTD